LTSDWEFEMGGSHPCICRRPHEGTLTFFTGLFENPANFQKIPPIDQLFRANLAIPSSPNFDALSGRPGRRTGGAIAKPERPNIGARICCFEICGPKSEACALVDKRLKKTIK
jgi:hypothetical protein